MPWQENTSQKVVGLNPCDNKGFSLTKSPLKEACTFNLVVEFERLLQLHDALFALRVNVAVVPQIPVKDLLKQGSDSSKKAFIVGWVRTYDLRLESNVKKLDWAQR